MRLGFITSCLPTETIDSIAPWAASAGFEALEVAAWPADFPLAPTHIDVERAAEGEVERVQAVLDQAGLSVSAIAYYENNLHADLQVREANHAHLRRCVDAAAAMGCRYVGTFIGRDVTRTVSENLALGERVLPALVDYAGEREVILIVENCPMEGWHPDGYPANLAYSPELWDWMIGLGLALNFDPSHLVWLGIDPVAALRPYAGSIPHFQAKDTEVDLAARTRYAVYGRTIGRSSEWDNGWWRYRLPGRGSVDWSAVLATLEDGGFEGTVSIEHEDPVWSGTPERTRHGLELAAAHLRSSAPLAFRP